jgi:hypothetical protein
MNYDKSTADGQKRLMDESMGRAYVAPRKIDLSNKRDYGADPLGDGQFRMIPSGDIVGFEERCRRLARD